ncbi:hypothetical protein FM106_02670 [Brachybacterium faecium]|nr:hypothetical protein FM106_02670 [Brachybacterium faecium]
MIPRRRRRGSTPSAAASPRSPRERRALAPRQRRRVRRGAERARLPGASPPEFGRRFAVPWGRPADCGEHPRETC